VQDTSFGGPQVGDREEQDGEGGANHNK
jgi:hypothetical protein